jgi:DNA-binding NarL/FixJ family response regulator
MKILIAVASRPLRERLARELAGLAGLRSLGLADNKEAAIELVRALEPDVVVVDLAQPDSAGLELLLAIAQHSLSIRLLAIAPQPLAAYEHASLILGAEACFSHNHATQDVPMYLLRDCA